MRLHEAYLEACAAEGRHPEGIHVSEELQEFYRAFWHEMRERPFEWAGLPMWAGTEARMGLHGQIPDKQPRGSLIERVAELESRVGMLTQALEDLMRNLVQVREAVGLPQPQASPQMERETQVYYPGDEGPRPGSIVPEGTGGAYRDAPPGRRG